MRKKIIFLIVILIAIFSFLIFWNWKRNIYSKEILKLEILAPGKVELAKEFEYVVKYKNNGKTRLEDVRLIFEYPNQAIVPDGSSYFQEIPLEDIYPGEEKINYFKARLLGKEGERLTAKARLSYRPKDLKAPNISTTTFTTTIESVPITFEFDLPTKIESGKKFITRLNYFSNIDYPLTDLRIKIVYPPGFEFIESIPRSIEKTEWEIPVLNKAQGGRVEISGRLFGEVGEPKFFNASLGIFKDGNFILLKETTKGSEIIKPSIYLRQEINKNPRYVALPGDWLHYEIYFKNIGNEALNNLFIVSKLEGEAFDFQTIKTDLGITSPGDNSIVFDWRDISKLRYLIPMEEGSVDFWVKVKDDLGQMKNPVLKNKISISQIQGDQIQEEFVTKISSKLEIVQKGYFQDDIFGNSGPIPPKVGETTTYTIVWQAKNYYSLVKDIKVKAVLPERVKLTGKIFPEEESSKFSFDPKSREIVWSIGDLEAGKGVNSANISIAFQVALTPKESDRGHTPEIISEAKITGEDSWTEKILEATAESINTTLITLPDDETISEKEGRVQ